MRSFPWFTFRYLVEITVSAANVKAIKEALYAGAAERKQHERLTTLGEKFCVDRLQYEIDHFAER